MTEQLGLTSAQRLMLASQNFNPGDPLYNSAFLFVIEGAIDVSAFRLAFAQLVDDAEALRTVIRDPQGAAWQEVRPRVDFNLPVIDVSDRPDPETSAFAWAQEQAKQALDIEATTFDSALLKCADNQFAWYLNQHHLVTDARSVEVLFRRLEQRYIAARSGLEDGIEPLPSVAAYVEYESGAAEKRDTNPNLTVVPPPLYGRPTGAAGTDNERIEIELSQRLSDEIGHLIDRPGNGALTRDLGLLQIFATATFAFLKRIGGQETITVVAPAHNRVNRRFASSAGLLMELFPIEVTTDRDETFASLHRKAQSATLDYLRLARPGHADPDINRHVNVVLNYLTMEFASFAGNRVATRWLHPDSVDAHHQLRIQVFDFDRTGRFTVAFDVATGVLGPEQRAALAAHFQSILNAMVEDWDATIEEVDLLGDTERIEVLAHAAGEAPGAAPLDVVAMFLDQVARMPDSAAVREGDITWTYAELDTATERLAARIEPKSVIGVALPRSARAVIAMLGILRAGATYVPIDPAWPVERISYVAADAGCSMILADESLDVDSSIETLETLLEATAPVGSRPHAAPEDLAYILYTSGSTGEPKGVMVERGSLVNYISWAAGFYGPGLTFPLFTPLTFDLTITSIFVPLASGGSIVAYPSTTEAADLAVLEVFGEDEVDIVKLTPSHLALLADRDLAGSRIRQLILGGEDLPTATAARIHASAGGAIRIHNEYGPTEATVGCIVHTYDPATDQGVSVPIGRPIAGMRAYVLDSAARPVPMGVPGELWLAGTGLARGYVGKPDLTETRFPAVTGLGESKLYITGDLARLRHDGTIEYLGRRDDQVKIKGIRVELGEIEAALASHPDVTATAARLWEHGDPVASEDLIHCVRCGLASDYPGVSFDAERVCNECRAFEDYSGKARVYFKPEGELATVLTSQRGERGKYDCVALLSGGKDSTYVLCRLVDMGLRVLALTLDNGYISDQAKGNIGRVVEALGVEHRYMTTPAMNDIFVDSLQRFGNVCNGCYKTIYTLSMQTALDEDIPYIVTGLSRGQFFETRLTAELFTELTVSSDQIDANVLEARKAYHRVDDAVQRLLDVSMFEDDDVFEKVQFVDFYRFVDVGLDELYTYLDERVPWSRPTDTGRSTNCLINDVGIYYHRKVRGYHNYALPYSWDVRMGHKTRDDALAELDDDIDVAEVARMLEEIGFPEDVTSSESGRMLVLYYVAPEEIPAPELKKHMAATLPRQLVPNKFVRLDVLPLTQNGKVDRQELPSPDHQRPEMETTFIAPRTDNEVALTGIWEQVLGVDGIGIRDNYFDLGGDSISAVQIIARAHRQGLPVTMNQLAEQLTIENLAMAVNADALRAERIVGTVSLTPIQHWFFEEVDDVERFHHAVRIATGSGVDLEAVRSALDALVVHHDALRQSFRWNGNGWESSVADQVPSIRLEVLELDDDGPSRQIPLDSPLLAPFDLAVAPLMRAALVVSPDGTTELALVAHHLIVDSVSWSHIVDDLGHLTRTVDGARSPVLPAVTTSLRDWTERLSASAPDLDAGQWETIAATDVMGWPSADPGSAERTGHHRIDPDTTSRILAHATEAGLGVDEVLIAGLTSALCASLDTGRTRLFLEGHGRESDTADMDVTRTMGWFTSLFPVVAEVPDASDPKAVAVAVRDQLSTALRSGRDYGVLRYLHPEERVRASVALDHREHLVFNYLGRTTHAGAEEGELVLAGPLQLVRPPESNRIFGAEVNAYIDGEALTIEWATHGAAAERLESIVEQAVDQLLRFVDQPGDDSEAFPLAGLDEAGLGKLASILDSSRGENRQ
ncbi:MAG: amino acid adenylation domain-containing protein [Acidimicrobiia bacterium]|nr:amino acid adenylation domain-containing protein [Acidimicrobiia bacterium]